MRNNTNTQTIEGRIYQHNLQVRKVENQASENYGKEFINGTIDVATDDAGMNILQVHYSYVTEITKSGKTNGSYTALKRIIDSGKTILTDGMDNATMVRLTPSAALNDFYPQGQDQLVSSPRNEGGFVTIVNSLHPENERSKFTFDALITNVKHIDADPEKNIAEDYTEIRCAIFNFKNDILPFTLVARNPGAMKYFEGLDATGANPVYTKVWGKIVSKTISIERKTESAFGEDAVDTVERRVREWVITGAAKEPYEFGAEEVMTSADIKKALADREVMLAETKKRSDEYYANRNGGAAAVPTANAVPEGGFNF